MIRQIQERDREWLIAKGWDYDETFFGGFVYTSKGVPVVAVGGWKMLETHAVADERFSTPGTREAIVRELHRQMEARMKQESYREAITFFDTMEARCRRLVRLGWQRVHRQVWARKVGA